MLEMRPGCERCDIDLPADETTAYICSFECTWCTRCAIEVMEGRCRNCGGELRKRPPRAPELFERFPPSTVRVYKPDDNAS